MYTPTVIFIRHSKLVLPYRDHGEMPFATLSDLGTGVMNPPIDPEETTRRLTALAKDIAFGSVRSITASPSQRCQDTAAAIKKVCERAGVTPEVTTSDLLKEISFDLAGMDTDGAIKKAFENQGISTINSAVFKGMINGTCESIEHACERVAALFAQIPDDGELRIFLTHDFLMRVIELYIRRRGSVGQISVDDLEATQRNSYLSGFATDRALQRVQPISSDPQN